MSFSSELEFITCNSDPFSQLWEKKNSEIKSRNNLLNCFIQWQNSVVGISSHTLPHLFHFYLRHKAEQRPWDGQSQSAGLSRVTAALHTALDVKPAQHAHKVQRKQQLLPERKKRVKSGRIKSTFLSTGLLKLSASVWMTLLQIPHWGPYRHI